MASASESTKAVVWGRAAGRCEFRGCNRPLWHDNVTHKIYSIGQVAHQVAAKSGGPRGEEELSEKLANDPSNLMLLCYEHHRLVDRKETRDRYPRELLEEMKREHEERIELQTMAGPDAKSEVVLYGATVGDQFRMPTLQETLCALSPERYPAPSGPIEFSLINHIKRDDDPSYWTSERENLEGLFDRRLKRRLEAGECPPLAIFAKAPQPLLIELGRLITDKYPGQVYQLHREPTQDWLWREHERYLEFRTKSPQQFEGDPAVILSLSATITPDRIQAVLGDEVPIWTLTVDEPHTSLIQSREQLSQFRQAWRDILNQIREKHEDGATIHLFPAVPVSVAVEIGRTWQPKADLLIRVYDQNNKREGFVHALDLWYEEKETKE